MSVVVDKRSGAGSTIGNHKVARATPIYLHLLLNHISMPSTHCHDVRKLALNVVNVLNTWASSTTCP